MTKKLCTKFWAQTPPAGPLCNIDKLELDNKILNTTLEPIENEVIRLINEFNSEIDELKKNAYKCDDCDECFGTKSKFHLRNIF